MAKKSTTKKKTTKKAAAKKTPPSKAEVKAKIDQDYLDDEEPPYCLEVEYDGYLPEDENAEEPKVVSASVYLSTAPVTMDKAKASGHSVMVTYVEFKLPEALLDKKFTPEQLEKFILNDEGRWSELIKELG
jgi:hypothetical protein